MIDPQRLKNTGLYGALCGCLFFLGISKALTEIFLTAAFILTALVFFMEKKPRPLPPIYWIGAAGLIASGLVPLLYINPSASEALTCLRGAVKWIESFAIFAVFFIWTKEDEKKIVPLLSAFAAGMILVSLSGYFQLLTGHDFLRGVALDPGRIVRMKSSLGAPNTLSTFYCFAIPAAFCLAFQKSENRGIRALGLAGLLLFVPAWILTFSRAGFFALFFSTCVMLLCFKLNRWITAGLALLAAAVAAVPALRGNFISSLNWQDITIGERMTYWKYAVKMIAAHPIFGSGLNLFYVKLPLFMPDSEIYRGYAHNCYLQITAEAGVTGLFFFLLPFVFFFTGSILQKRQEASQDLTFLCLMSGWMAVLMFAFFDNQFFSLQPAHLFWACWGMLAARRLQLR